MVMTAAGRRCRLPWHEIDSAKRHLLLEKVQNKKVETTLEVRGPASPL